MDIIQLSLVGDLDPILGTPAVRREDILDGTSEEHAHTFIHSFTPSGNLASPIDQMTLLEGEKNPDETNINTVYLSFRLNHDDQISPDLRVLQ